MLQILFVDKRWCHDQHALFLRSHNSGYFSVSGSVSSIHACKHCTHTHIGKINVNSTRIDGDNLCDDELLEWVTMNCFKDELEGTNCHVMVWQLVHCQSCELQIAAEITLNSTGPNKLGCPFSLSHTQHVTYNHIDTCSVVHSDTHLSI